MRYGTSRCKFASARSFFAKSSAVVMKNFVRNINIVYILMWRSLIAKWLPMGGGGEKYWARMRVFVKKWYLCKNYYHLFIIGI